MFLATAAVYEVTPIADADRGNAAKALGLPNSFDRELYIVHLNDDGTTSLLFKTV